MTRAEREEISGWLRRIASGQYMAGVGEEITHTPTSPKSCAAPHSFFEPEHIDGLAKHADVYVVLDDVGRILDYGYDKRYATQRKRDLRIRHATSVRKWKPSRKTKVSKAVRRKIGEALS